MAATNKTDRLENLSKQDLIALLQKERSDFESVDAESFRLAGVIQDHFMDFVTSFEEKFGRLVLSVQDKKKVDVILHNLIEVC